MEPGTRDEQVAKKKTARFDRPVIIIYRDYRKRLLDCDGGCSKYFTDAIVSCNLLVDDSTEYVKEVKYRQTKSKEEKLVIEIWEA